MHRRLGFGTSLDFAGTGERERGGGLTSQDELTHAARVYHGVRERERAAPAPAEHLPSVDA